MGLAEIIDNGRIYDVLALFDINEWLFIEDERDSSNFYSVVPNKVIDEMEKSSSFKELLGESLTFKEFYKELDLDKIGEAGYGKIESGKELIDNLVNYDVHVIDFNSRNGMELLSVISKMDFKPSKINISF